MPLIFKYYTHDQLEIVIPRLYGAEVKRRLLRVVHLVAASGMRRISLQPLMVTASLFLPSSGRLCMHSGNGRSDMMHRLTGVLVRYGVSLVQCLRKLAYPLILLNIN